jgi:Fe-Mn family superoxide dismutase
MTINRRQFLFLFSATTAVGAIGCFPNNALAETTKQEGGTFTLPPLPYDYKALEPYIDEETMRFHHDKHHAAYVKNLNAAVAKYPELKTKTAEQLISNLNSLPRDIRTTVKNNGGGHINHKMFWEIMSPNGGGEPTGTIAKAIERNFGSFAAFKHAFNETGKGRFGSGWIWLVRDGGGKLKVMSTANQYSPLMEGLYPIMGNDVWEHAYYLKYKNDRAEYLNQWWNIVNWEEVNKRFEKGKV